MSTCDSWQIAACQYVLFCRRGAVNFKFKPDVAAPEPTSDGRVVRDSSGGIWSVNELSDRLDPTRTRWSLVFSGDAAIRRVREYPGNWRELSDSALIALSFQT